MKRILSIIILFVLSTGFVLTAAPTSLKESILKSHKYVGYVKVVNYDSNSKTVKCYIPNISPRVYFNVKLSKPADVKRGSIIHFRNYSPLKVLGNRGGELIAQYRAQL